MPIHATGLYSVFCVQYMYVYIQYTYILLPSIHLPIDIMDYGVYIKVRLLYSPPNPSSPPTSRVSTKTIPSRLSIKRWTITSSNTFIVQYIFSRKVRLPYPFQLIIIIFSLFFTYSPTSRVSTKTRPASVCFTVFTYIYFFTYSDIKGVQENQTCQGVSIIILVDLFLHLLRNQRCPENQISKKVFIRKLKIRSTPPPPTVH